MSAKLIVLPIDASGRYCGDGCQFRHYNGFHFGCRLFGRTSEHTTKSGRTKWVRPSVCRKAESKL